MLLVILLVILLVTNFLRFKKGNYQSQKVTTKAKKEAQTLPFKILSQETFFRDIYNNFNNINFNTPTKEEIAQRDDNTKNFLNITLLALIE